MFSTTVGVALRPAIIRTGSAGTRKASAKVIIVTPMQDEHRLREPAEQEARHGGQRPRCVGSSASRKASPTRLKESAISRTATPGKNTSQGASRK